MIKRIIACSILMLTFTSCEMPAAVGPDMSPIEDGLRFLGIALVAAMIVSVIGNVSRRGGPNE